ncbi:bifunctional 2-C-methyl-D-erythritol 4-phosphate cytidylyltransferase/2-C-methyl-D-erythritol 2,4-cyclodiphosphate synthase [Sphingomonas solaris]|uniref:Bifunctional enzyme IspD/IspF n=1 Tax=Alterirhizorhabdus solaris TaxID=2529389 RepID=A0A558QSA2_9SPHN|nr:bifunctional 2-C-methyl-D-erythritol 4-phosphate cytidylyltransferase/2-C-methyl-D-erythritol 2,4-cyclodiphosphate synthase [Sphingomonas solaris]TVV70030.1 bifunctional 2-C-methyl-D-erythritol 4-phosphate cytidylyltransferase/2-C-methyl-D-erythritol 2,4-cyclodiphosphate synthase [Sphingomonas solaris]
MIVAAGSGTRMGGLPKQYRMIAGRSVLAHAIDRLAAHPGVDTVQVVIGAGQHELYRAAIGDRALPDPVEGGATRRESVLAGLAAVATADRVLIHDAARPFVPAGVIDRLLAALDTTLGAVPVLSVADSLARIGDALGEAVPREGVVRVQTPQAFDRAAILAAHRAWPVDRDATDDAQVARASGLTVAAVAGDAALDKLTFPADFAAADDRMTRTMIARTGMGFDVHAFCEGDRLWLGGLEIPHDRGLAGHSDADVALHAIVDALLGTVADGDIGSHFPPSDPRWRGAASDRFVVYARDLIRARGGIIDHVDCTIICEAPKVGPHRDAIRARVAAMLQVREGAVSIKATTTERLGFTGRREGIAAQAVATVRLPIDTDETAA